MGLLKSTLRLNDGMLKLKIGFDEDWGFWLEDSGSRWELVQDVCLVPPDICSWALYTIEYKLVKSQIFGSNKPRGVGCIVKEAYFPVLVRAQ